MKVAALLALAVTAPICLSQSKSEALEDGGQAPRHCWTMAGGCGSKSGAALGEVVQGPVDVAWRFPKEAALKGVIEGEPLVWDNRVLLSIRESDERRTLQVIDLLDGKPGRTASFQTKAPLEPVVWNGVVVLRSAPNKIEAWRLRGRDLEKMPWLYQGKAALSAPVMLGREIYVRSGGSLVRLTLGRAAPVWEKPGPFRGTPSVRGDHVYALLYRHDGWATLVASRRDNGVLSGEARAGQHDGGLIPPEDAEVRINVLSSTVCVRHAATVLSDLPRRDAALFRRTAGPSGVTLELLGLLSLRPGAEACAFGKGYVVGLNDEAAGPQLVSFQDDMADARILADRKLFSEFLDFPPSASCGGVTLFGSTAVDEASRRMLWSAGVATRTRAVPARDCVLVVESGNRLCALRAAQAAKAPPRLLPRGAESRPGEPVALGQALAVLRDATLVDGKLAIDAKRAALVREGGAKPQTWQLDDVLAIEDPEHRLLYAGPEDAAIRGLALLAERGAGDAYATLAVEADKTQDAELVERLIGEAWSRGATSKDLTRAEAKLKDRIAQKSAPKEDESKKVLEKEKAILAEEVTAFWTRYQALPAGTPWEFRSDLLRAIVERDPRHREAQFAIRDELPAGVTAPDPFEAAEWLDFIDAIRQTPIEVSPPPRPDDPNPTPVQRELGSARSTWREDLVAIQSKSLLIITPVRKPGRIARCLSGGELVCEALEKMFAGGEVKRDKRHPIRLFLYESQAEYQEQCARSPLGTSSHLSWTAGNYSPIEQLARMYIPAGKSGFERVFDVYSHEMTHAWIEERCPLFGSADRGLGRKLAKGHWITEGFATMIENFSFDLRARSFRMKPQPSPLEIVANASEGDLIPWQTLYGTTVAYFAALDMKPSVTVPSRWVLGGGYLLSKGNFFYAQAGATCLYLFDAENGKYRDRLMKYVGDHYGARKDQLSVETAFGFEPAELGARVVEYAKSVAARGKPR